MMQTQSDVTARLAALRATLAKATVACPDPECQGGILCEDGEPGQHERVHDGCQGTGEVARFPGFREVCEDLWHSDWRQRTVLGGMSCPACKSTGGTGWQVRAGGMEDALAGLNRGEASRVHRALDPVSWTMGWESEPMPPPD